MRGCRMCCIGLSRYARKGGRILSRVGGDWADLAGNPPRVRPLGDPQIVHRLQIEPRLSVAAEVAGEAHRRIGRDAATLTDDIVDTWGGHTQRLGERVGTKACRTRKVFPQRLVGTAVRLWQPARLAAEWCDGSVTMGSCSSRHDLGFFLRERASPDTLVRPCDTPITEETPTPQT